jgi:uncharacterized protein (DUF1330 family)
VTPTTLRTMSERIIYALLVRLPLTGVERFEEYERSVPPLLAEHGGVLVEAGAEIELLEVDDV